MRTTHTYATLEVSPGTYDEIAQKLKAAGYGHAFNDRGEIDMHGLALVKPPAAKPGEPIEIVEPTEEERRTGYFR